MELQENLEAFTRNGISVCAVSYDPVDVLHDFSERHGIQYPLLSDEHSEAIEAFGILNTDLPSGHKRFGIPHPGTFIVDGEGVIVEKFFHEELHTRDTPIAMLQ